ncbi:unnamed protein product [Symbiodinium sp. CCMP2456]|nr:unnamed protein product [Symbiodinium sp. CCMP2456]
MSCLTLVGRHARTGHGHIGKVQQASYQGLAENLAAFYAKAGRRGLESTNAPSVLLRGQPMSLRHAIKQLVPPDMVVQMRTAVPWTTMGLLVTARRIGSQSCITATRGVRLQTCATGTCVAWPTVQ